MNFLKTYKDKIEGASAYDENYVYYLYERFVREFIPTAIEESINNQSEKVEISFRHVEKFLKKIIEDNLTQAISSGKSSASNKSKYNVYISNTVKFLHENLPFGVKEGYIVGNLMDFISFYYTELQLDARVLPKTKEDIKLSDYTFKTFKDEVIGRLIPELIQKCKDEGLESVVVQYSIDRGTVRYGSLVLRGLNLYEFGKYVNMIPHTDLTNYAGSPKNDGDNLRNQYTFQYSIENFMTFGLDLGNFEKKRLLERKAELQAIKNLKSIESAAEEEIVEADTESEAITR